jgi:toxin FitB
MNVVDSSGWLAYFADEANAERFGPILAQTDALLVPAITVFEVVKVILRGAGEDQALQAIAAMQRATVVDLTPQLATAAARLSLRHSLPMADSLILATARAHDATIWTQDVDFSQLPRVEYFPKA